MKQHPAKVFVIDDEEAVRDAIAMTLETVGLDYRLFASGSEFLQAFHSDWSGCVVLDIRMPGMSGLDLQRELNARQVSLPVIFITGHGDIPMAVEAMRRGAIDFIRKPFRDQELLDRIQEALQQDRQARETLTERQHLRERIAALTPREREVFDRVAEGQANKVIAIELGVSERTVEVHRAQVMKKLQAKSLAQLVRLKIETEKDTKNL